MKLLPVALLTLSLSASNVLALTTETATPLTPGKPAGVEGASLEGGGVLLWVGLAAVAAGIAIAVSNSGGNSTSTSTAGTAP